MFYIISPVNLEKLQSQKFPIVNNMIDLDSFMLTEEGKEFFEIAPLCIKRKYKGTLNDVLGHIAADIAYFGCCYNNPLNVYILLDTFAEKILRTGNSVLQFTNIGKCLAVERKDYSICKPVPSNEAYLHGANMDEIYFQLKSLIKTKPTKVNPCLHFVVTKDGITAN
jgi:hypothetical protein